MFLDPLQYSFLEKFPEHAEMLSRELSIAASRNDKLRAILEESMILDFHSKQWSWDNSINREATGYDLRDGGYSMLALFKKGHEQTEIATDDILPGFSRLLSSVKGLHYAAIAVMSPGARIQLHAHNRSHLIFHLLLNDLDGGQCDIICDGHSQSMKKLGDTVLFDYSLPHESLNSAVNSRVNLMIDFLPDCREFVTTASGSASGVS